MRVPLLASLRSAAPCAAISAGLALLAAPAAAAAQHGDTSALGGPRKLLVIDLDDAGFDLLRETPTPTLDFLEQNGRFFTNFMTSPVCSPTRAMLMTGAFPSHPDLLFGQVAMGMQPGSYSLPPGPLVPLPQLLKDSGFTTAKTGKWHLSANADAAFHPQSVGFDEFAGSPGNVQGPAQSFFDYDKVVGGQIIRVDTGYLTTDETDDTIRAVQANYDFVWLSYHAPHRPWHEPPAHLYTIGPLLDDRDEARAMLQALDMELARLLGEAIPRGYTVIAFSDNGTPQPIGGLKGTMRDGGIINPFWAYGPGIEPGVDDSLVSVTDLYATITHFFGITAGVGSGQRFRGPNSRSFIEALRGGVLDFRWSWSERFTGLGVDPRGTLTRWRRAVRSRRYKLVWDDDGVGERKLVDLQADPDEQVNLLDDQSALSPLERRAWRFLHYVIDRVGRH